MIKSKYIILSVAILSHFFIANAEEKVQSQCIVNRDVVDSSKILSESEEVSVVAGNKKDKSAYLSICGEAAKIFYWSAIEAGNKPITLKDGLTTSVAVQPFDECRRHESETSKEISYLCIYMAQPTSGIQKLNKFVLHGSFYPKPE